MASELKIARAFFFERRCPISSSEASGRPRKKRRTAAKTAPAPVVGVLADALAVMTPLPLQRK